MIIFVKTKQSCKFSMVQKMWRGGTKKCDAVALKIWRGGTKKCDAVALKMWRGGTKKCRGGTKKCDAVELKSVAVAQLRWR